MNHVLFPLHQAEISRSTLGRILDLVGLRYASVLFTPSNGKHCKFQHLNHANWSREAGKNKPLSVGDSDLAEVAVNRKSRFREARSTDESSSRKTNAIIQRAREPARRKCSIATTKLWPYSADSSVKKKSPLLLEPKRIRFRFIKHIQEQFHVSHACTALDVSRAGFYRWQSRCESATFWSNTDLRTAIESIHRQISPDYGSPRVFKELNANGVKCSRRRVEELMRRCGIRARKAAKVLVHRPQYKSSPPVCNDLVNREFRASAINRLWLIDVTCIPLAKRNGFLCALMDVYSRRIVASCLHSQLSVHLPIATLRNSVKNSLRQGELIIHSDRGPLFAANLYRQMVNSIGARQSMGQTGCYDNAPMESFFRTLKSECCNWNTGCSLEQMNRAIKGYIDGFYNLNRRHSALHYLSPREYEASQNPKAASP